MAVLVHRIMSYQSRQFHTLEHVFGFLEEDREPEFVLAAVFHDLVYFQVDDGLPGELVDLLGPYIAVDGASVSLASGVGKGDWPFRLCLAVFGMKEGQRLGGFQGLNEFLSALAFACLLSPHLAPETIAAVVACIEASIPFRKPDATGRGPAELLAGRLFGPVSALLPSLPPEAIERMVHRSVCFGNVDVRDFALEDAGLFLGNTWKLMPESNASLRRRGAFSIREYRVALQKTQGFFLSLDPEAVYHSYAGEPDAARMESLGRSTRRNLAWATTYLKAKFLAVAVLEACAEVSGGDAPMALFMGDLPMGGGPMDTLADHLPPVATPSWMNPDNVLYRLLRDGRVDESSFDLRNSPVALYLYNRLEPREWAAREASSEAYFSGVIDATAFLRGFDPGLRRALLKACAEMVPTRRQPFEDWLSANP
jgi:hypothetical protein